MLLCLFQFFLIYSTGVSATLVKLVAFPTEVTLIMYRPWLLCSSHSLLECLCREEERIAPTTEVYSTLFNILGYLCLQLEVNKITPSEVKYIIRYTKLSL